MEIVFIVLIVIVIVATLFAMKYLSREPAPLFDTKKFNEAETLSEKIRILDESLEQGADMSNVNIGWVTYILFRLYLDEVTNG